ncbi:hypothetical protein I8J29_31355, partial [Paenibacillus sp. MWE-103]
MNETNGAETKMTELKACAVCGTEKPLSAYTKRSGGAGRRGTCRACLRKRKRDVTLPAGAEGPTAMTSAAAETADPAPARQQPRTAAIAGEPAAAAEIAAAEGGAFEGETPAKPKRKR